MNKLRKFIVICAALGWWGTIYPQFAMVKGTYGIVQEEMAVPEEQTADETRRGGRGIYWEMLAADRGQIRFRSRLFTELKALREYLQEALPLVKENDT